MAAEEFILIGIMDEQYSKGFLRPDELRSSHY